LPKIEEDGKSCLRRPKLYKGVVQPYKKKKKVGHKVPRNPRILTKKKSRKFKHMIIPDA
jgi:hypothetical protein